MKPGDLALTALRRVTETGSGYRDDGGRLEPVRPKVGVPPEGGPMPDAQLDPAEAAWGFYKAVERGDVEEQQAWADAIQNGGLNPAQLIELGIHFKAFNNGGPVAGKLIDLLKGA